ncbi:uncharacterized protein BDZ99DRAFT_461419 [Mytilinidion resinicola]|uniref:Uncharacterized protein n=1 Tax=Mytilinidion resinicola TaxID=574789 RepID=A0A6A6YQY7_9PEZI|nr:uncharacterized protein BDZ99DRAFT_461419 [Mytilinidion resinicola]KAF2811326.1 hypothetical protein BDZ99DRAFT_461419 [Mytilinidion resinicola]
MPQPYPTSSLYVACHLSSIVLALYVACLVAETMAEDINGGGEHVRSEERTT